MATQSIGPKKEVVAVDDRNTLFKRDRKDWIPCVAALLETLAEFETQHFSVYSSFVLSYSAGFSLD